MSIEIPLPLLIFFLNPPPPPGQVVWAKVEGHEWWPAKVVRRRAVPREVGPPPSLPGASLSAYLPVIFFTPEGIPGEASTGAPGMDEDEAEYAWLTPDLVKPFWSEDGGDVSADPGLQDCVIAAEAAIKVRGCQAGLPVAAHCLPCCSGYYAV